MKEEVSVPIQPPPASRTHLSILRFLLLFMQSTIQQVMKAMDMRRMMTELTTDAQTATRKPWISKGDRAEGGEEKQTDKLTFSVTTANYLP